MAAEARVTHRALDGRRFLLSGQLDLGLPFTSVVEVGVHGRRYELTAGAAGLDDDIVQTLGATGFDEELRYQRGTLRTVRTRPYDPQTRLREDRLVAAWRGARYCLVMQAYGASTADLLAVLRTLRIDEDDDGLAVRPNAALGSDFAAPATVLKQVPGLGLLELSPLTAEHARRLPSWQGRSTPAGELFRDSLADGKPYFVLSGHDTWATVVPLADTVLDRVPALLGQLHLQTVG